MRVFMRTGGTSSRGEGPVSLCCIDRNYVARVSAVIWHPQPRHTSASQLVQVIRHCTLTCIPQYVPISIEKTIERILGRPFAIVFVNTQSILLPHRCLYLIIVNATYALLIGAARAIQNGSLSLG